MISRVTVGQCYKVFESTLKSGVEAMDASAVIDEAAARSFLRAYTACFLDLCENSQALDFIGGEEGAGSYVLGAISDSVGEALIEESHAPKGDDAIAVLKLVSGGAGGREKAIPDASWYFAPQGKRWLEAASGDKPSLYWRRMISVSDVVLTAFASAIAMALADSGGTLFGLVVCGGALTAGAVPGIAAGVATCLGAAMVLLSNKLQDNEHCVYIRACQIDYDLRMVTYASVKDSMPDAGLECDIPYKKHWRCRYRSDGACTFKEKVNEENLKVLFGHLCDKGFLGLIEEEGRFKVCWKSKLSQWVSDHV